MFIDRKKTERLAQPRNILTDQSFFKSRWTKKGIFFQKGLKNGEKEDILKDRHAGVAKWQTR